MAIIHPYADPSAHGKVTPGLQFKRRGPRVVFGAAPRPKNRNTAAQQLQRDKIRQAVANYKILNYEEKIFLRRRGSMLSKNPYQLYTSSQLKNNDWSKTPGHQLQTINNMVIFDLKQDDPNDMRFSLKSTLSAELRNNIILWNRLDSETAGVVSSDEGPDFDWAGTPSHPPGRFINGAYSNNNANHLTAADNGAAYLAVINKHMGGIWIKTDWDCINGVPQDSNPHALIQCEGQPTVGGRNYISIFFHKTLGLLIQILQDGNVTNFIMTDSNITFDAGDEVYLAWNYNTDGIDGSSTILEVAFGTDSVINIVGTSTDNPGEIDTTSKKFSILTTVTPSSHLTGSLDNLKIEGVSSSALFQEKMDNRNNVAYESELGYVFDNENIFYPGVSVETVPELQLIIESFAPLDWAVPFYWALAITWSNKSITERTTLIRLPKIVVNSSEAIILYLSTDMSNYFDQGLFRLGATDNV